VPVTTSPFNASRKPRSNPEPQIDRRENAAKAHRSAAEHHGKGHHAKGEEQAHSKAAFTVEESATEAISLRPGLTTGPFYWIFSKSDGRKDTLDNCHWQATGHPAAFGIVLLYAAQWMAFDSVTFDWNAVATLAV
jgi:hypothetical protein